MIGVIPEKLHELKLADEEIHELVVTPDMRTRKAAMEMRAEAFIAMPGGFGTLEEILEVLVLKQLWYHEKPIVFLKHPRGIRWFARLLRPSDRRGPGA